MPNPWDTYDPNAPAEQPKRSLLMRLAFKTGFVKTTDQAHKLLLAVAGVFFLISMYLFASALHSPELVPPPPEDDMSMWESEWEEEYQG